MRNQTLNSAFLIVFLSSSSLSFSQDSIPIAANKIEEKLIDFQGFFFKALAEKAVENYELAIQNLERCNALKPNNVAVLFEFSKNYYYLGKPLEASLYAKQALAIEPNNKWILMHLVSVYTSENNFASAIAIQEKLAAISPKNNELLVLLYFQNNEPEKVKALLLKLDKANLLTPDLKELKKEIFKPIIKKRSDHTETLSELIQTFKSDKSFATLSKIVSLTAKTDNSLLLKYTDIGIDLFPTQAIFYLEHARALNKEKQFEKAIKYLQNGIDFVIENKLLAANFYEEFVKSYIGLGNKETAKKYKEKAMILLKK